MRNKKGIQLGQAFGAVLALVLVGLLVIIAIYLFVTLVSTFTGTASGSASNEAITVSSVASTIFTNASLCGFGGLRVLNATNASAYLAPGNYTVTATGLSNLTSMGPTWMVNYTYTWGGQACTASNAMITNFSGFPALLGLVGTIIFLALVIGVLISAFAFGGKKGV